MLEEVNSLTRIVEEFSEFAKFPPPCLKPDDLNEIVRATISLFSQALQKGSIRVELYTKNLPVAADRDQIKRAIVNLVKNALEAIPPTSQVTVRTVLTQGNALLLISDDGPGLADSIKQNLFTPYFTTKAGGSGLGLVIVKKIVSEHDGRIKIGDQQGGGTVASIELPLRR